MSTLQHEVKRGAKQATRQAKKAVVNPWMGRLAQLGYIVRGAVYATIGLLAFQLALGQGGQTASQTGALVTLAGQPFGKLLLVVMVIGLIGYSLWGLVRAIFDPLHYGTDTKGLLSRAGFLSSAVSYAALSVPALQLLMGQPANSQAGSPAGVTDQLINRPFGKELVILFGLLWVAIGIGQLYMAYKASFARDWAGDMSADERTAALRLGKFGYGARGVVLGVIGLLTLRAGLFGNPNAPQGFDAALAEIARAPYGVYLLALIGLGLIAFGLYSAFSAKWVRLPGV